MLMGHHAKAGTEGAFLPHTWSTEWADFLINGEPDNGTTAVLGADTVGNAEGFAAGRVVRFGIRLRF